MAIRIPTVLEVERMDEQTLRAEWHRLMGTLEGDTPKTGVELRNLQHIIGYIEEKA